MSTKKPRKFGTGKIALGTSPTKKWLDSAASQISSAQQESIDARFVGLSQVTLSPDNPRKLDITPTLIRDILAKYPLPENWLNIHDDSWHHDYIESLRPTLSQKALKELSEIILLAYSIKSPERLLNPITVYRDNHSYLTLAGERRYLAHHFLKTDKIAARILDTVPNALEMSILQWEENNQRSDLTLIDKINNIKTIVTKIEHDNSKPMSVSELMKVCGLPRVTSYRYLQVIRYKHNLLLDAISTGQVTSLKLAALHTKLTKSELSELLNPTKAPIIKKAPAIKIHKSANTYSLYRVLEAAAKQLKVKSVVSELKNTSEETINSRTLDKLFNQLINAIDES